MRVTIINPNLSPDISVLDMATTYLATYLNERTKHTASLLDFTFHVKDWKKHLHEGIKKNKPDIIGITACSMHLPYVSKMAKEIKEVYNLPIILGGYHPTLEPEDTIVHEYVDAICIGEGEYAMEEYLNALEKGKSVKGIKGIWAKENGEIIRNQKREFIKNVDDLPIPNYDLWEDIDKYLYFLQMIYFLGRRGCPFSCTYCSEQPMKDIIPGKYCRDRDPKKFVAEIKYQWNKYKDRGMRIAHLFDPVFPFDREWTKKFCEEYKKQGLTGKLPFSVFSRADTLDEDKIKTLANAGCKIVRIGVEAGSERIRNDIYEKNIPNKKIFEVIDLCKKYGLTLTTYYILGGPTENLGTLRETFRVAKRVGSDRSVFFIYRPLPKTKSLDYIENLNMKDETWEKANTLAFGAVVKSKELPCWMVWLYQKRVFLHFYPRRILRLIKAQKHRYFINLIKYFYKGLRSGANIKYLYIYFHVCCGDNLFT